MDLYDYLMEYLEENFDFKYSNSFIKNTLSNFIDYAVENFNNDEDQLAYYLSNMIDGAEFKEIKKVISDYEIYKKEFDEQMERDEKIVNYEKNEFNSPIIDKIIKAVKNDEFYSDYNKIKVNYILIDNKDKKQSYAIVELEDAYLVRVNLKNMQMYDLHEDGNTFDSDIFWSLELGEKIAYMSLDTHYGIWQDVYYFYPENIRYKEGLKIYLQYCKDHNINKDLLNEVMDVKNFDKDLCDFVSSKDEILEK